MTTTLLPVMLPGCQVNVDAPVAVIVIGDPEQDAGGLELAVTLGEGRTFNTTTPVSEQPLESVPVAVYVVLAVGATVTELP